MRPKNGLFIINQERLTLIYIRIAYYNVRNVDFFINFLCLFYLVAFFVRNFFRNNPFFGEPRTLQMIDLSFSLSFFLFYMTPAIVFYIGCLAFPSNRGYERIPNYELQITIFMLSSFYFLKIFPLAFQI